MVFDYQHGRGEQHASTMLQHYAGYLQTDGYAAYESLARGNTGITLVGCLAHARRKFDEAKSQDKALAEQALAMFQEIYSIEARSKEQSLSAGQVLAVRTEQTIPILNNLHA